MRRGALSIGMGASAAALLAAGCGGGSRQDASEPSGSFPVRVVSASFPSSQALARGAKLKVAVKNAGSRPVPDLALTVSGKNGATAAAFGQNLSGNAAEQNASTSRPIWILDGQPNGTPTAYVNTWTLGALKPGRTKTFVFDLTPVKPGHYTVRYVVAAGLAGKAKAVASQGGGPVKGSFEVTISNKPRSAVSDTSGGG